MGHPKPGPQHIDRLLSATLYKLSGKMHLLQSRPDQIDDIRLFLLQSEYRSRMTAMRERYCLEAAQELARHGVSAIDLQECLEGLDKSRCRNLWAVFAKKVDRARKGDVGCLLGR